MKRRAVVKTLSQATMLGIMAAGLYEPLSQAADTVHRLGPIGVQLYTLRDDLQQDFEGTLVKVAALGYQEIELVSLHGQSPRAARMLFDRYGLRPIGYQYQSTELRNGWQQKLEVANELGLHYVICAYIPAQERQSLDDYKKLADGLNQAAEAAKRQGLKFAYHNHDFEFWKMEGEVPYDLLLASTDPNLVQFEIDAYWIAKGGQDPIAYFDRAPNRFSLLHLKDMDASPSRGITEVGRGILDFKRLLARAEQIGIKHYFAEQDYTPGPPLESLALSYDYLQALTW